MRRQPPSIEKCKGCDHYTPTDIFTLCAHAASSYWINGKHEQHTVQHMRMYGCGEGATLFIPERATA